MPFSTVPYWKRIPALRLLLPFAAGILLQWHLAINPKITWGAFTVSLLVILFISSRNDYKKYLLAPVSGITLSLLFIALGAIVTYRADIRNDPDWLGKSQGEGFYKAFLLESPLPREKTWKATAELLSITTPEGRGKKVKGKVILYFSKSDMNEDDAAKLRPGSTIVLRHAPQIIPGPANPGQFNFQRFCLFDGITHQAFLRDTSWMLLNEQKPAAFRKWLESLRNRIVHSLQRFIPDAKAAGLAEALLIGYKNDLDKELLQTYADTGVVHIIAISGLHLGIIYWILRWFTRALPKRGHARWARFFIVLSGLWLFSLLAGAQPSVLRSAVMFSFILVAETIQRRSNIYNTLCCSAFFLLLINPFWLWDIGFQLSYAAVLSLILYMQPIYRSWYIAGQWLDYLWQMCAVTLAAQILTIPLCLYHFHQFPTYFLPANLVCVPLSSALLIAEIILIAISPIEFLAHALGWLIHKGIDLMNWIVRWIVELPHSLITGFNLNELQVIALYIVVVGSMAFLLYRNRIALQLFMVSVLIVCISGYWQRQQINHRAELRIYSMPSYSSADVVIGKSYTTIFEDSSGMDRLNYQFQLKGARVGLRNQRLDFTSASGYGYQLGSRRVLVLDRPLKTPLPFQTDVLWLRKGARLQSQKVAAGGVKQLVADGSLPAWQTRPWREAADREGIAFHDVKTDGYFALRLW